MRAMVSPEFAFTKKYHKIAKLCHDLLLSKELDNRHDESNINGHI